MAASPVLVGTFSWSEFFFFGPLDKCFDVFPARRDRPVEGGQSSHRPLVRWLGPTRSSFRERIASSRGAPVAYLLWLLATFLKALQPPAAQPTAWTLPQLGRRQLRDLTASLNLEAKKHGSLNWDPLLPWKSSTRLLRIRRRRGPLIQRKAKFHQPPRNRWRGWPLRGQRVGEASHPGPPSDSRGGRERSPARPTSASSRV